MTTWRRKEVGEMFRSLTLYARRRLLPPPDYLPHLLAPAEGGRESLTTEERRAAVRGDFVLRRAGVACLWRSAIVTELLRDQGVSARIRLSVHLDDPRTAHAECEVGGEALRSVSKDLIPLR